MYPEYKKVSSFLGEASLLMKTSKKMEDIFYLTTKRNQKEKAVEYINSKGKLKRYNYSKFRSHSYATASVLSQFLYQTEKHLPIILKVSNGPHWGELFWAILMAGYKPLLVDAKTSKEGTQNLIDQAKAVAIISEDNYKYSVLKISFEDLLQEKHHYSFSPDWENEVIFCSSGTTGNVKLMVFNGENLCHQICASLEMCEETKDIMYPKNMGKIKILAMVPFHHIFGFVAVFLWYTFYGKTLVFPSSNAPSDIQYICQKVGITHVYSVPLFWDSIAQTVIRKAALEGEAKSEILDKMIGFNTGKITKEEAGQGAWPMAIDIVKKQVLGSKVRFCISGGGYLTKETLTVINGIGYPLYNGFGMTEIGVTSVELSPLVSERLKGLIGKPLHGIEYAIEPSNGNPSEGELLVKSPTIHSKEIAGGKVQPAQLDANGYFHTGDIVTVNGSGKYFLKGRIKDIIINSDGENIFPDELEIFFKNLPHVTHLSVLGVDVKSSPNQNIVLALELDNQISDEELENLKEEIKNISKNLPHKVHISNVYLAMKKLPLANNMKVKRYLVKKAIESKNGEFIPITYKRETKVFKDFDMKTIESILFPMRKLFSKILILPEFKIDDNGHWVNDLGGDSMSYVELVQKVEAEFKIKIPEELYGQLATINDFVHEVAVLKREESKK